MEAIIKAVERLLNVIEHLQRDVAYEGISMALAESLQTLNEHGKTSDISENLQSSQLKSEILNLASEASQIIQAHSAKIKIDAVSMKRLEKTARGLRKKLRN